MIDITQVSSTGLGIHVLPDIRKLGQINSLAKDYGPPRIIYGRDGTSPYLSRYYIEGKPHMPDGSEPFDLKGNPRQGCIWPNNDLGIYIHKFHRSDEDNAVHNHPWEWGTATILYGSYREHWANDLLPGEKLGQMNVQIYNAGDVNIITKYKFHRVELISEEVWTLFVAGPRYASWGFIQPEKFIPWRKYLGIEE